MLNLIFKKKINVKINIASIFRNNESYLQNHFIPNMEIIEKLYTKPNFYFYTDGNKDKTEFILKEFCKIRNNAKILIGKDNVDNYKRDISLKRIQNIIEKRNFLLQFKPFEGEFTIFIDSDIYFDVDIVEVLLNGFKKGYTALFPNGIDKNYLDEKGKYHYYDVLAFIDTKYNYGYERFAENGHCDNPFFMEKDIRSWNEGKITCVNSAFGGIGIYKSEIINSFKQYECNDTCKILKNNSLLYNEHWSLNFYAMKFGKLGIDPQAMVYHHEI